MITDFHKRKEEICELVMKHYQTTFSKIFPQGTDFTALAQELLSEQKASDELFRLEKTIGTSLAHKKVLEIGSGYGMVVCTGIKNFQAEMHGIEPGEQFSGSFSLSQEICTAYSIDPACIQRGVGEALPYAPNTFDVVYSSNVLEHVNDPQKVLAESIRVCKEDGFVVCVVPNYGSFWEGHYGFFFLPHSPKWALKLIARFLGRDPSFIDTLQLVTFGKLTKWLASIQEPFEIIGWGEDLFAHRLRTLDIAAWALLSRVVVLAKLLKNLKITELALWFSRIFHWETPFVVVLKKGRSKGST